VKKIRPRAIHPAAGGGARPCLRDSFLASENSRGSASTLDALRSHLAMTADAVVAKLHHGTAEGEGSFEGRQEQMLRVADSLWSGIVEQFPARFGP
jgi:hypothetical protein